MAQVGTSARFNSLRRLMLAEIDVDSSASLTYKPAIPIGVQSEATWKPTIVVERLKGARGTAEIDKYVDNVVVSGKHGEINLAMLAMLLGGAAVAKTESVLNAADSKQLYYYTSQLKGKTFGILGQPHTVAAGPADLYVCVLKCTITDIDLGKMGAGGWAEFSFTAEGAYTVKDEALFGLATLEKRADVGFDVVSVDLAAFQAG